MHRCSAGSTLSMQLASARLGIAVEQHGTHLPCSLPSCSCLACCMFGTAWEGDAMTSLDPTTSPSRREPVVAGQESRKRETISSSALATHYPAVQLPAMDATPQICLIPVAVRLLRCTGHGSESHQI